MGREDSDTHAWVCVINVPFHTRFLKTPRPAVIRLAMLVLKETGSIEISGKIVHAPRLQGLQICEDIKLLHS